MTLMLAIGLAMLCVGIALVLIASQPEPELSDRTKRLIAADLKARHNLKTINHTAYTGPVYNRHDREVF